jgi:hypothetical protein
MPASLVYQAANQTMKSGWMEEIEPGEHSVFVSSSNTGWSNNDMALAWLELVFNRFTKAIARRKYRILILDGHGSHITHKSFDFDNQYQILLMIFPPHSTHSLNHSTFAFSHLWHERTQMSSRISFRAVRGALQSLNRTFYTCPGRRGKVPSSS